MSATRLTQILISAMLCLFFQQPGDAQHCLSTLDLSNAASLDSHELLEEKIRQAGFLVPRRPITIPIVFHIVYNDSSHNIPDAQILSQLDVLNRDYNGQNENMHIVPEPFRNEAISMDIRFCLPAFDPEGNPTTGITRTRTDRENIGNTFDFTGRRRIHYSELGGKDGWDPERYLNVWIGELDGYLGFATFPGMAPAPEEDGIIIIPEATGTIGLASRFAPYDRGHTLSHEIGHYLNLYHTCGPGSGSCDTDDFVEDTPLQESAYSGCPAPPQFSCGSEDMFMNMMDLTNDHCIGFFTAGQKERALSALLAARPGLLETPVACDPHILEATGLSGAFHVFYSNRDEALIVEATQLWENPVTVALYTMDGRLITELETSNTYYEVIPTDNLAAGIYVCVLSLENHLQSFRICVY